MGVFKGSDSNARFVSRVTVAALATAATVVFGAAGAGATPPPSVTGGGTGPLGGDRLQVQLSAVGTGGDATGRFNIVHHSPDGLFARAVGQVDCLVVAESTAIVTGTVTQGSHDLGFDLVGTRVSLVIHDEEIDSVDMDLAFLSGHAIPPCSAEPILTDVIDDGQFMVRP
jgi:hypothetical protein